MTSEFNVCIGMRGYMPEVHETFSDFESAREFLIEELGMTDELSNELEHDLATMEPDTSIDLYDELFNGYSSFPTKSTSMWYCEIGEMTDD